jgi:hypothetical protein
MPPASIVPIEHVLTEHRFSLLAGGGYFALGAGGAITGRGANLLLIDDPTKSAADANSDAYRRSLHEWFESTAYTRLQGGSVLSLPAVQSKTSKKNPTRRHTTLRLLMRRSGRIVLTLSSSACDPKRTSACRCSILSQFYPERRSRTIRSTST